MSIREESIQKLSQLTSKIQTNYFVMTRYESKNPLTENELAILNHSKQGYETAVKELSELLKEFNQSSQKG